MRNFDKELWAQSPVVARHDALHKLIEHRNGEGGVPVVRTPTMPLLINWLRVGAKDDTGRASSFILKLSWFTRIL